VISCHMNLARSAIDRGDFVKAQQAYQVLLTDYTDHPLLPRMICEVAIKYEQVGRTDKAEQLHQSNRSFHQQALATAGTPEETFAAHTGIARASVWLEDHATVQETVDLLLTQYQQMPDIRRSLFLIGEDYHLLARKTEDKTLAQTYYQASLALFENELYSQDNNLTVFVHYMRGLNHQGLGDDAHAAAAFANAYQSNDPRFQYGDYCLNAAENCIEKLLAAELQPDSYYRQARAYEQTGNTEKAKTYYLKYLDTVKDGDPKRLMHAQKQVQKLSKASQASP
jgi:tetratricopeptide (TPR) repeat protein